MSTSVLRRVVDELLLLVAAAAGGYAVWELRQPWAQFPEGNWLWWLLIGAGLLGGMALRRAEAWLPDGQPIACPAEPPATQARGLACLAAAGVLTGGVVVALWPDYHHWRGTQWPWLAALLLTIAGGWLMRTAGTPAADERVGGRAHDGGGGDQVAAIPRWLGILAFVSIAMLGVYLRVHRLNEIPAGIYVDETNASLDALYTLEGRGDSPFAVGWYETPMGYIYYMAGLFNVFGANYVSLKAVSLIPAVLTVLAIYPLGRVLFGPPAALAAMFLMAVSRWHLTMSRWGWNEVAPPLFQVLATFYLIRGLRERRARDFAAGGLISGLMVYTYLSSRLALATLAVFSVYWLLADRDGPLAGWRRHWKGLLLFLAAALIALAPLAVTYLSNPFAFLNRVSEISIFNQVREEHSYQPLVENVRRHLKFFHQKGDLSGKHNLPGEPELDPVTGALFVVGLGYGLCRLGDRRRGLLWIWVFVAMAGGMLSVLHESPQAYRTLNAVPAIALLAGDVLVRLARSVIWLKPPDRSSGTGRAVLAFQSAVAVLVVAAGLAAAGAWDVSIYFGQQASSPLVQSSFNLTENGVAKEVMAALERGTVVYLSPRFYDFSPLRFLTYGLMKRTTGRNTLDDRPYRLARPEVDLPIADTGSDALFLLDSHYWSVKDYFLQFYPSAEFERPIGPEGGPLYLRVRVSESDVRAVQGLQGAFTHADGTVDTRVVARVDEDWSQQGVVAARWSGGLRVDSSGAYDFITQGDLKLVVDGERWTGSRFLGQGVHKLEVSQPQSARDALARLSWKTPHNMEEIVPATALFRVGPPQRGLTARYFPNETWEGAPLFAQTTPFLLLFWPEGEPVYAPFSVRFTGYLHIDNPGSYHLRVEADDGARLWLDGKEIAEGVTPLRVNRLLAQVELSAGDHPIQIDYFQRGGSNVLEFYWSPPGRSEGPVPPEVLVPEAHQTDSLAGH